MASPTELRKGKVIKYSGTPHLVLDALHRTQGRQAGFLQVTLRNLNSGASTNVKIRSTDQVEILHTNNKKLEYSFKDSDGYHFLDTETFEDTILNESMIHSSKDFLVENSYYNILFVEDSPLSIELPSSVEIKVISSPEGIRGDTASNVQKPATLETGLIIQVPLFIKEGEIIKVSTNDKSYVGRA